MPRNFSHPFSFSDFSKKVKDDKGRPLSSLRKWKFYVDLERGSGFLLADGTLVPNPNDAADWIGTDNEADREANRRTDLFEDRTGETVDKVVYESQGKVKNGIHQ